MCFSVSAPQSVFVDNVPGEFSRVLHSIIAVFAGRLSPGRFSPCSVYLIIPTCERNLFSTVITD